MSASSSATTTAERRTATSLPASELIEATTGGLRYLPEAGISRVILAPSYFSRPYNFLMRAAAGGSSAIRSRDSALDPSDALTPPLSVVRLHRALGDQTRLRILKLLAPGDLYLTEIAQQLDLSKPTIKHHLAQLRAAGPRDHHRVRHGHLLQPPPQPSRRRIGGDQAVPHRIARQASTDEPGRGPPRGPLPGHELDNHRTPTRSLSAAKGSRESMNHLNEMQHFLVDDHIHGLEREADGSARSARATTTPSTARPRGHHPGGRRRGDAPPASAAFAVAPVTIDPVAVGHVARPLAVGVGAPIAGARPTRPGAGRRRGGVADARRPAATTANSLSHAA